MATHSFGPGLPASSPEAIAARSGSPVWNTGYGVAAMRASLISMALLAVLAVVVLF
jgi:hypothetical protein